MLYRFGDFELDTAHFELRRDDEVVSVQPQVFELLQYLVERPNQLVSKDELFASVWGGRCVSDAALSSRIKMPRQAIGDTGTEQRLIRTLHGRGFRFIGAVERVGDVPTADAHAGQTPQGSRSEQTTQDICYCTTRDSISIAYATSGAGPPIVKTANWLNHLELDWDSPIWRHWLEALTAGHLLLRYDERGTGLSDWTVDRITFDDMVDDLEAVVDAAGIDNFALLGISQGCAVSIAYAVRHPSHVTRLVLCGGYAQGWRKRGDHHEIARREAIATLIAEGWGQQNPAFRQIFTSMMIPEGTLEQMRWFNDMMRASASPENALRLHNAFGQVDVTDLLPRIQAPTLVVHAREDQVAPFEQGKMIAAGIPGARLLPLETRNHLLTADEPAWDFFVRSLSRFLTA